MPPLQGLSLLEGGMEGGECQDFHAPADDDKSWLICQPLVGGLPGYPLGAKFEGAKWEFDLHTMECLEREESSGFQWTENDLSGGGAPSSGKYPCKILVVASFASSPHAMR